MQEEGAKEMMPSDWFTQAAAGVVDCEYFGLILFFGYLMWVLFKKYKLDVRLLVIAFALANAACCVLFGTDIALIETWKQGAILPYGVLWHWMDPYWWTTDVYKYVILGWMTLQTVALWLLGVRRGKCGWNWVLFAQLFDLGLFMSKNLQSVPALMFVFLTPVFAPLLVGFFLVKFPIGFAFNSLEWQCTFGNYQYVLKLPTDPVRYIPVCGRFDIVDYPGLLQGWILYAMFAAVVVYAFWKWWYKPNEKRIESAVHRLRKFLVCDCEDCKGYKLC